MTPRTIAPELEGHALRLAIAAPASVLGGLWLDDWLTALVAPILVAALLQPGAPRPGLGKALALPLALWLLATAVRIVAEVLALQHDVLIAGLALVIFLALRHDARHGPKPGVMLLLIVVLVVSVVASVDTLDVASLVDALGRGALFALLAILVAHVLVPGTTATHATRAAAAPLPTPPPLYETIGRTALLLAPVVYFIVSERTGGFYILIAAITVVRMPAPQKSAAGLVLANLLGGALGVATAGLIAVTPSPLFGILAFALMLLALGMLVEGGGTRGAIAQGATGTAIILLVLSLAPLDGTEAYVDRVLEIATVTIFIILGRALVDGPPRRPARGEEPDPFVDVAA